MDNQKWWWLIGGVVAGAVVVALVWLIASHRTPGKMIEDSDTASSTMMTSDSGIKEITISNDSSITGSMVTGTVTSAPGETTTANGEMVSVNDQPAGSSVVVSSVVLSKPSWVAIKDTKGWILGAAWVKASGESVSVPLLRPTAAGGTYQAVIYADNGDKVFDFKADSLVTASEGAPVSATFSVK